MFNIGPTELIVIVIIALIVFGPRRLPEIGRTVGKSLREFRKASQDLKDEFNFNLDEPVPGDRPAPTEPGYENWRTADQAPSHNGADGGGGSPAPDSGPTDEGSEASAAGTPGAEAAPVDQPTPQEDPGAPGTELTDQVWAPDHHPAAGSGTAG